MPIITIGKLITYLNIMAKKYSIKKNVVLIANGEFPKHTTPLQILKEKIYIICCDGAANSLIKFGKDPDMIIGDLDSIDSDIKIKYAEKIIVIKNQSNNDFRKSLNWISENISVNKLFILGATGLREDHTFGNIVTFLYQKFNFTIKILTNTGIFHVINSKKTLDSFKGQHISIFSINPNQKISTNGLKYELNNDNLDNLYAGTLNMSASDKITIQIDSEDPLLVYAKYKK